MLFLLNSHVRVQGVFFSSKLTDVFSVGLHADDVMDNIDGAIRVSEIADLLRAEYAVVTGELNA